jgi:DNA gyrase subunit A
VAILDMQLRRLAALERQKIEDEQRQIIERIAYLEDLLANPAKILQVIRADLQDINVKYGDARRTRIAHEASEDFRDEDLVPDQAILISITQRGYIKRVAAQTFRAQSRGGRGVIGHATKEDDEVLTLIPARSLNTILFFSDRGKVYSEKAYQIPDAERTGRGIPMVNLLSLDANETITAAVAVPAFDADHFCVMATRKGRVKRIALKELAAVRPSGIIALKLESGDELGWVRLTNGQKEIILVTEQGQALRFSETQVRPMGRTAAGVNGIRLAPGDAVTSMEVVEPQKDLLVITAKGYGKRSPLHEYPVKRRATGGVQAIHKRAIDRIGVIVSARVVGEEDDLTIVSTSGVVLRTKVKDISRLGRAARGVTIMQLQEGDRVASMARMEAEGARNNGNQTER